MFHILKSIFNVNNVIILKFTCAFRIPLPVAVDSHQVRCRIALRPHLPVKVSLKLIKLSLSWTKASSRERLVHSDDFCKHCNFVENVHTHCSFYSTGLCCFLISGGKKLQVYFHWTILRIFCYG